MPGPLKGFRVIEIAGVGPISYACMLLSDLGAEVIRVDRTGAAGFHSASPGDVLSRGRRSIAINLKAVDGVEAVLKLVENADVLIEGFRPGVMEKLGLGPDICATRNPRLVYARMTGWGQEGPLAHAAGHDINYIAITGALGSIGRRESGPVPPLNLIGDFGGGSMFLIMGVLSALLERTTSGKGQVIDSAISDGVISLMACIQGLKNLGIWNSSGMEQNMLDGAAPYYDTYRCADNLYVAIGSIEPQFYALLAQTLGIDLEADSPAIQFDRSRWPELKSRISRRFEEKTRQEWCAIMEGTDICFAPVLSMDEATQYPHNVERRNFITVNGVLQTAPAPRFSRSQTAVQRDGVAAGADTREIMENLGYDADTIRRLEAGGIISQARDGS